ncbi:7-deoxyloganetin glucosyltransferase [Sarracenia purpurea var. burkii]
MADSQKPHAVVVPHPAQGHVFPILKVAKLLHHKGFYITFVNTEYNQRRLLRARGPTALDGLPDFRFAAVPDGLPFEDGSTTQDPWLLCDALMNDKPLPFFKDLVSELNSSPGVPPITCIVCDGVMSFPLKAAQELGIPCALFWTTSACGFLCYSFFRKLVEKGLVPLKDDSCLTNGYLDTVVDGIPAMEGIRLKDIPTFIRTSNPDDVMLKFSISESEKVYKCSALILNTVDELERGVLDALSATFPPVFAIGPLQQLEKQIPEDSKVNSIGLNLWKEDLECLSWLDKKEPNSVIYVNFGSVARLTPQELLEFGWGLANSKQNFLWAIRPDLVVGDGGAFPPEFEAEIRERGLLVSWSPQERILSHPSVGGFLTHCGWNSILESIVGGVPMICWTNIAEQPTNSWFICNHWGLGMEISEVEREEVERLVRELMVGESGKKMKAKAEEWKKVAEHATAVAPPGSSYANFDRLVNEVLLSKFQKS